LNRIGSEIDHAAKTLLEKTAYVPDKCRRQDDVAMANEASLRFPWFSRRYLFMLTSAWNEKLSAPGQASSAIKKLAGYRYSCSKWRWFIGQNVSAVVGGPLADEI
jgi:hypothetical protein